MNKRSEKELERVLLHKIDVTLRRFYHQTLYDVAQDLALRNILDDAHPTPHALLGTIRRTGILTMHPAPPVARMKDTLDRFVQGTLGVCDRCGRSISRKELLNDPSVTLCTRCRHHDN